MPRIAGEDSPAGQKAAEHAYLLIGLDDNSTECWGDQILHYVGTLNREQEKLGLVLSDAGCTEDDDYLQFIENLAARAASTQSTATQPAQTQLALTDEQVMSVSIINGEVTDYKYAGNLLDGECPLYVVRHLTEGQAASILAAALRFETEGNKPMANDMRALLAAQPVSGGKS